MATSSLALVFLCSVDALRAELRAELRGHAGTAAFFGALLISTFVLTVATLRKVSRRVATAASEVCESEA